MAPCRVRKWGVQSNIWTSSSWIRRGLGLSTGRWVLGVTLPPGGFLPAPAAQRAPRDANASEAAMCPCCLMFLLVWISRCPNEPFAVQASHVRHTRVCLPTCRAAHVRVALHVRVCVICVQPPSTCTSVLQPSLVHASAKRSGDGASTLQGQPHPSVRSPHVKTLRVLPQGSADPRDRRTPLFPEEPPALFSLCLPALGCCRQSARQMLIALSR